MPAIIVAIAGYIVSSLIFRFFVFTGLSIISFYFINDLVTQAQNAIQNAIWGLPADALAFIKLYKIDQGISVILSAFSIAAYIKTAKAFIGRS